MAVPFSNTKLRVPRGFQNLLEGLAKEVLRNQPDNIYAFAAVYFSNLLKIRENKVLIQQRLVPNMKIVSIITRPFPRIRVRKMG
ncbi:Sperm surface protein Sp17 [Holothuria leucospilota]|uniref:Sperm surface protein Sp17 n=1 Tax=Holothuria leucospilota TaxID=206669 RepID=A0A9Q0YBH6_HOLLE|nr:Sperm surface protein Sp17 [Holothuria leucospilota]